MTCRASRRRYRFEPGDSLLLYTDGVTEAWGPTGMFGPERLVAMIMRGDLRGPELLDGILEEVATFTGSSTHQDDVTLLSLELAGDASR